MTNARSGLPKSHRLLRPGEYTATLKSDWRWRDIFFGVYALRTPRPHGRLGIIVSRKTSPRAVVRNRVKRQIRESFRGSQQRLNGLDIVVVASPKAGGAETAVLRTSLDQFWEKVELQCNRS
ncbi:MAG: ribonuclease P protein component [Sulfuricaulis sp.]|uniref:ribonuclease P protein component n=1 Tax=Sulfuricaulis sp. TaxID=2003553 RepID=UPI002C72738C|nr:ribonuclease P protein component [Sulfuricaulis sp.]